MAGAPVPQPMPQRSGFDADATAPTWFDGSEDAGNQRWWGTPVMGHPSAPNAHPDNPRAAGSGSGSGSMHRQSSMPYTNDAVNKMQTQPSPDGRYTQAGAGAGSPHGPGVAGTSPGGGSKGTMDKLYGQVYQFTKRVEVVAGNVWGHLTAGPSVADAAWGRMSVGAKVLSEGGFEKAFKSLFKVDADETLKKTYACYLSTSTGPVAGTLYISSKKFAFCSDRPLSYTPKPGEQAFSFYKVVVPLDRIQGIISHDNSPSTGKYIQVTTVDNYEFWFMGFVNYDKGLKNMQAALSLRLVPAQNVPLTRNPSYGR